MALHVQTVDGKREVYLCGKHWNTLTKAQKSLAGLTFAGRLVLGIGQLILLIAALRDLRKRPAEQVKGRKLAWFLIVFIDWIGPIAYFIYGRKKAPEGSDAFANVLPDAQDGYGSRV